RMKNTVLTVAALAALTFANGANGAPQEPSMVVRASGPSQEIAARAQAKAMKALAERLEMSQSQLQERLAELQKERAFELTGAMQEFESQQAEQIKKLEQELEQQAKVWRWEDGDRGFAFTADSEDGWLGVSIAEVSPEKAKELKLAAERGVLITDVDADSP